MQLIVSKQIIIWWVMEFCPTTPSWISSRLQCPPTRDNLTKRLPGTFGRFIPFYYDSFIHS